MGGKFYCLHVGELIDYAEKEKLEGETLSEKLKGSNPSRKNRYMLRTSFLCDGFSVKCLVTNTKKAAKKGAVQSETGFMKQANEVTRRKKPNSDPIADEVRGKVEKIIGVDLFSGGFCCKNLNKYSQTADDGLKYDEELVNLTIKTSALNDPTHK